MKKVPLIIAHRGAMDFAPENTMKSFALAYAQGADGVELDIYLTRDKHLVVVHDDDLMRLGNSSLKVKKSTLADLQKVDVGEGEKVPSLDSVFEEFGQKFSIINVEIKSESPRTDGIEKKLAELINHYGLSEKILVSSFNPLALLRMKELAPNVKRGYLMSSANRYFHQEYWMKKGEFYSFHLDCHWRPPGILSRIKKYSERIWLWPVKNKGDLKGWENVEAVITSNPLLLKTEFGN